MAMEKALGQQLPVEPTWNSDSEHEQNESDHRHGGFDNTEAIRARRK
jgi:hypothetical protein